MRIEDLPLPNVIDLRRKKKAEILDEVEQKNKELQNFFIAMKKEFDDRIRELEHNPDLALEALMEDYRKQMEKPKPVKMGRPGLSDDSKKRIKELREQGMTVRQIADRTKLSVGVVHKVISG